MTQTFPEEMGDELGGKTFEQAFVENPRIIEFVTLWTDNCTGLFLDFQRYVIARLQNPFDREEHEARCRAYVIENGKTNLPRYLAKYQ